MIWHCCCRCFAVLLRAWDSRIPRDCLWIRRGIYFENCMNDVDDSRPLNPIPCIRVPRYSHLFVHVVELRLMSDCLNALPSRD